MKLYPPAIIRFFYRYIFIGLFVVFPACFTIVATQDGGIVATEDRLAFAILGCFLALFGCFLVHIGFWEKFFSVLIVDECRIIWKCPFRKSRMIMLTDCKEIGGDTENRESGMPFEIIYFSTKHYPQQHRDKKGIIKNSDQYIKFWYSEELYRYLIDHYPSEYTGRLVFYHQKRKKHK